MPQDSDDEVHNTRKSQLSLVPTTEVGTGAGRKLTVLNPLAQIGTGPQASSFNKARRDERCDAAKNRQRVLQAARTLFAERGVEAVTMTDIAEAAGVGKGTLYRRYAHKGQLCQALMDDNTRAFQAKVLSDFGEEGHNASPLLRLKLFVNHLLDFTELNAPLLEAVFEAEMVQGGTSFYSQPSYDWLRLTITALLREAVAAQECHPDLDIDYLADALLAPFQVGLYLHQRQVRGFSRERILNGYRQLLAGILS